MPFPNPKHACPTKNEIAAYLADYAHQMRLPIHLSVRVDSLEATETSFVLTTTKDRYEAAQVIITTNAYTEPKIPEFAAQLRPNIHQLHSSQFSSAARLIPNTVVIVGASNSGAEIAFSTASTKHET